VVALCKCRAARFGTSVPNARCLLQAASTSITRPDKSHESAAKDSGYAHGCGLSEQDLVSKPISHVCMKRGSTSQAGESKRPATFGHLSRHNAGTSALHYRVDAFETDESNPGFPHVAQRD
jgi:hypothetical protein